MPKHFHKQITKREYIDDIIDLLKIKSTIDQGMLRFYLMPMLRNGLGNLYYHIQERIDHAQDK